MLIKRFLCNTLILTVALSHRIALAENITSKAMIQYNDVQVNNAKAYDLLRPADAGENWQDDLPMCDKTGLKIWFPLSKPVMIKSLKAGSIHESADVEFRSFRNGKYNKEAQSAGVDFQFLNSPLPVSGVELLMTNITNRDHDVLKLANWRINGKADGEKLYNTSDLQLECEAEDNVFELPRPIILTTKVSDSIGLVRHFRLTTSMTSYQNTSVKPEKILAEFELKKKELRTFEIKYDYNQQGPYLVSAYLYDADTGIMLAAKRIIVGLRNQSLLEHGEVNKFNTAYPGKVIDLNTRIKEHGTLWSADATQSVSGRGRRIGENFFQTVKNGGGELLMAYMRYSDFEPLPGVYNFEYFDHILENAGKFNLGLNLGLWWWDFQGPTQFWLKNDHVLQPDGSVGKGKAGIYSAFSPFFKKHATRAAELMIKRYLDCPQVWLWFPHPYGVVDHDGHGVKDYNPYALKAWAEYLKNKYGSLAVLNQAYAGNYNAWKDIPIPEPENEKLRKAGKLAESTRILNLSPAWIDWLDMYHQSLLDMRVSMMELVRKHDKQRGIGGVNATGGVGKADEVFRQLKEYDAFYGDQGLNINHQTRRLIAKRQYGLKLRHEDIAPVTLGRRSFNKDNIIDRCDWLMYQCTFLGLEHFNYVFLSWTGSPFWDRVFANPVAKRIIKESSMTRLTDRQAVYLHSFYTDVHEGNYEYNGISLYRWWLMNGLSAAIMRPGNFFEMLSLGGNLDKLKTMKLAIDDNSRIMDLKAVNSLVDFVNDGGKLVLIAASGEKTIGSDEDFLLLKRLGYGDTEGLKQRDIDASTLVFNDRNGVFRKTVSIPVNFWSELNVPENGRAIGYIKDKVGAVTWKHGKGEVVFLGGLPGAISEAKVFELYELFRNTARTQGKEFSQLWQNAERELGRITGDLTEDLCEWAQVHPLFGLNDDIFACIREKGSEKLIYMYNKGHDQTPVLRIDLPEGKYRIQTESLDAKLHESKVTAALFRAPGVALPELGNNRFMRVRILPE